MVECKHGSTTLRVEKDKLIFEHKVSENEHVRLTVVGASNTTHVSADYRMVHPKHMAVWWRGAVATLLACMPAMCKNLLKVPRFEEDSRIEEVARRETVADVDVALRTLIDAYVNET